MVEIELVIESRGHWQAYRRYLQQCDVADDAYSAQRPTEDPKLYWPREVLRSWADGPDAGSRAEGSEVPEWLRGWPSEMPAAFDLDAAAKDTQLLAEVRTRGIIAGLTWPGPDLEGVSLPARFYGDSKLGGEVSRDELSTDPSRIRKLVALRLLGLLEAVASLTSKTVDECVEYVVLVTDVSRTRLGLLLDGTTKVDIDSLRIIAETFQAACFGDWVIYDGAGLKSKIERTLLSAELFAAARSCDVSVVARAKQLVEGAPLHVGAADPREFDRQLKEGWRRSPTHGSYDKEAFRPPKETSRYRPLYEALLERSEDVIRLTMVELNKILTDAGKPKWSAGARTNLALDEDRFGYWKNGKFNSKRPQVQAWQAAGLRVADVAYSATEPGAVEAVTFEAMWPGRATWLEYRDKLNTWRPDKRPVSLAVKDIQRNAGPDWGYSAHSRLEFEWLRELKSQSDE